MILGLLVPSYHSLLARTFLGVAAHSFHHVVSLPGVDPHATRTQAPPASLILFSAVLEKSLALTITGIFGRTPLPRTLKYPWINTMLKKLRSNFIWFFYYLILQKGELKLNVRLTDLVTSITGALSLDFSAAFLVCSETSDHNLSVLTVGQCFQFLCRWKTLIPDFP